MTTEELIADLIAQQLEALGEKQTLLREAVQQHQLGAESATAFYLLMRIYPADYYCYRSPLGALRFQVGEENMSAEELMQWYRRIQDTATGGILTGY